MVTRIIDLYLQSKPGNVSAGVLENATYPDGTSVPQVAYWMEYGTDAQFPGEDSYHIPPRPFLRNTSRAHRKEWNDYFLREMRRHQPTEQILKKIGAVMAGQIRKTITTFTDPPNAPATIKAKGKDSPLRDTGTLLNSISWEYIDGIRSRGVGHKRVGK